MGEEVGGEKLIGLRAFHPVWKTDFFEFQRHGIKNTLQQPAAWSCLNFLTITCQSRANKNNEECV